MDEDDRAAGAPVGVVQFDRGAPDARGPRAARHHVLARCRLAVIQGSDPTDPATTEADGHRVPAGVELPGATDSEFHGNAGMGNTSFGDNSWKNDRTEVARQGIGALFAGDDQVAGGDQATKQQVINHRSMSEPDKAARRGAAARPGT